MELYLDDEYGAREELVRHAGRCFGFSGARAMIEAFQDLAQRKDSEYARGPYLRAIESLARQVGDAKLFERTRLASWPGPPGVAACVDIAEVYLETGLAQEALSWLERVPQNETFKAGERDALLLVAYGDLGEKAKLEEVAWRIFRRNRHADSMEDLLSIIGEDRRKDAIEGEVAIILADVEFSITDAEFLFELGKTDEAERYVLDRFERLNGDLYIWLTPLAKMLEKERPLAASAVYRALLDSILSRGRSQAYDHGVRYLRKLDWMAGPIAEWGRLGGHEEYVRRLREEHKRKRSFWGRYDG